MDYSTLKAIKSPRDSNVDAIDLSDNYANENTDHEKVVLSRYRINNNNNNNNNSRDIVNDGDEDNHLHHQHIILSDLAGDAKRKLNFSVDRILGNDINISANEHGHGQCDVVNDTIKFRGNNCSDCSSITNAPLSNQIFSVPFSTMATMLNFSKSIVRPMPVRYLTRTPTVPIVHSPQNLSTSSHQHFLKYHHQLHQQQPTQTTCNFKTHHHSQSHHTSRQTITTVDNSIVVNSNNNSTAAKRKRSWSRAVFSQLQRKGLEIHFQIQKYITKPDRRKLAARLGLTDAQVKVWFQNRRMKWRHTRDSKANQEKNTNCTLAAEIDRLEENETSSSSGDDEDEIDVVTE